MVISRFWFDSQNLLKLELSDEMFSMPSGPLDVFDGSSHYYFDLDFEVISSPYIMPVPINTPNEGFFSVSFQSLSEVVHWGADIQNDLSGFNGTECAVQIRVSDPEYIFSMWVKDYSPTSGTQQNPIARSNIDLVCYDFSGEPVADVPVQAWNMINPYASTDEDGHAFMTTYSGKINLKVRYPGTQEVVCDTTFFAEPGQSYPLEVHFTHVANEDPLAGVERGNFSIYPTVMRTSQSQSLQLNYDVKLSKPSQVELYDLRGRLLDKHVYADGGLQWQLPGKLPSGVYFLRLSCGKQNLGSQKLIILK